MDTVDNTVEEFELWNEEVVDGFTSFPNSCSGVEDGVFIFVEKVQCSGYFTEGVIVN